MSLYHFTDLWFLKTGGAILTKGLKPAVDLPPHGVVWLTAQPECTFAQREPECVISLFIPSNDKGLVPWATWLHQHNQHAVLAAAEQEGRERGIRWRSWYCYFGIIPPSMFRGMYLTEAGLRMRQEREPPR
jgi:hypothetical protein